MPELPEVETIKRDLNKPAAGKIIAALKINPKRCFKLRGLKQAKFLNLPVLEFKKKIIGLKIASVDRRAKNLIFKLTDNRLPKNQAKFLLIHLKMTGQLIYRQADGLRIAGGHFIKNGEKNLPNKYTQLTFIFNDRSRLFFNDLRQFGWVHFLNQTELNNRLAKLGPEPLTPQFTFKIFQAILKKSPDKKIKALLLDQEKIAGLGNIYADEVCFYGRARPQRQIKSLQLQDQRKLFLGIKAILKKAIEKRGSSINSYLDAQGQPGGYAPFLKVYGRSNKKCFICRSLIKKIKLAGRGAHFCPQCQMKS